MRIYEIEDAYPVNVSSDWIVNYVADLNDRDDPYEGDVPEHILEFDRYKLEHLPINKTDVLQHEYDADLASDYASMPVESMPPIVFDPITEEIIDGFHRVRAAMSRGELTILAYVGI